MRTSSPFWWGAPPRSTLRRPSCEWVVVVINCVHLCMYVCICVCIYIGLGEWEGLSVVVSVVPVVALYMYVGCTYLHTLNTYDQHAYPQTLKKRLRTDRAEYERRVALCVAQSQVGRYTFCCCGCCHACMCDIHMCVYTYTAPDRCCCVHVCKTRPYRPTFPHTSHTPSPQKNTYTHQYINTTGGRVRQQQWHH